MSHRRSLSGVAPLLGDSPFQIGNLKSEARDRYRVAL
jgi:hypothetical protein